MLSEWLAPLLGWLGIGLDTLLLLIVVIILIVKGD